MDVTQDVYVGAAVQYFEKGLDGDSDGPHAAIVTAKYSNSCVTLAVFVHHRTGIYVASSVLDEIASNQPYWRRPASS